MKPQMKLLIPFFTVGYPELSSLASVLQALTPSAPDYIELGLAHSDALADGPVIQASSQRALENGMNIELLCEQVSANRDLAGSAKLVLFSYYNPLLTYGLEKTAKSWKAAGGSCVLVPDLPPEESGPLRLACAKEGLALIQLLAPTSPPERIRLVTELSEEFLYLVAVTGVTGAHAEQASGLKAIIAQVKAIKPNLPVVIGFGIADEASAKRAIASGADGVVVGSALVKLLGPGGSGLEDVTELSLRIRGAL